MEKKKRRSLQFSKKISMFKSPSLQSKLKAQRELYENGLAKIFSSPPSHLGYKSDIEALMNEIGLKNDELLYFTILSLSKIARNKNEIDIIASYLYLMPDFIKLLIGKDVDKKEQDILKDLLNLSQSITYEKYSSNSILMKFGDKGTTAYIILDGQVDVLIKSSKCMTVTKNDYLFYLATLLKYYEYGLLNEVINENFEVIPLEIYDASKIKEINFDNIKDSPFKNDDRTNSFSTPKKRGNRASSTEENNKNNDNNLNTSSNSLFKLNEENEKMKEFKNVIRISSHRLLRMFHLKQIDKRSKLLMYSSLTDYIKRIELIPNNYKHFLFEEDDNKLSPNNKGLEKEKKIDIKKNIKEINDDESDEEGKLYNLKIYTYNKVVTLGKGTLFGEIALREANALRTGTLITSTECHCSVLNKRTFDICLKKGAEKYLKELLTYFVNLPIFIGISETLFYHKYYTYLSKKIMHRGNLIITQGEKPKNIILIQTGSYGLTTRISLYDLTKLIVHFIKENIKNKTNLNNNTFYDEDTNRYNKLLRKTNNLMAEAKSLMNENLKFKRFYLNEISIRVTEITCPDMVGYKEYVDENGLYAFSIESKSPENVIFSLDNKFYNDLQQKNYIVRNNQKQLLEKKINVIIQRLFIIRNSLVNSFFDDKAEKEIGTMVIKELENINNSKLKQKRFLKFKSIEYNINKKTIEDENEKNHKNRKGKNKFKTIKNISRNQKINKKLTYFNSYNQIEVKRNNLLKRSSKIYNLNYNKRIISKKSQNLNSQISPKKIYSPKNNNNENIKKIIKKKKILDFDSKEKIELFSKTYKEFNSRYNLNQKNNTENNSKPNLENQTNKSAKTKILNSPKINSASVSCKNNEIREILLNSLVWEEIKSKIDKNIAFNNNNFNKLNLSQSSKKCMTPFEKSYSFFKKSNFEDIKSPFESCRNHSSKISFNSYNNIIRSPSLLHRSSSEIMLNKKLKIKTNLNIINSPKFSSNNNLSIKYPKSNSINKNIIYNYASPKKDSVPKINLKMKKFISPQEIKLIREINQKRNDINIFNYHQNKCEKYKLDRHLYYNNNLKNRIKLFYKIEKK